MHGIILKNQNGYFTIFGKENKLMLCRPKGTLKKETDILVGDSVEYETDDGKHTVITKVYPRKNQLHRPPVSNIDAILLVSSVRMPDINLFLLDRMILSAENAGMTPIICINKCDLAEKEAEMIAFSYEKAGYISFCTSTLEKTGLSKLKTFILSIKKSIIVLSGPSGVGKSSLLNYILDTSYFLSGDVNKRTGRGKSTTRHAELVPFKNESYVMDTPGYTFLSIDHLDINTLDFLFKEFRPYLGKCHFNDCHHVSEPQCCIKKAVEEGQISKRRYESYLQVWEELKKSKKFSK